MKVAINELKKKGINGIYLNLRGVKTLRSLLSLLVMEINKSKLFSLERVNFTIGPLGIEARKGKADVKKAC